mmetsp:Transcript_5757/g.9860  ORF Transcript_5757/g.9860 Transcript_5757/m.9860 type:complete len:269 (+) Transcript_5757:107-913(+)
MPVGTEKQKTQALLELNEVLLALNHLIQGSGKVQRMLYVPYLQLMNDIYDGFSRQMNGVNQGNFKDNMDSLEKMMKINIHQMSSEALTHAIYYFCKFQTGSEDFWRALENSLIRQVESMSVQQLSKILLAFIMNNRPIPEKLSKDLINTIFNKFERTDHMDIFYLCVSLGKGQRKLPADLVSSDFYYAIFLKLMSDSDKFDLYQLSQVGNFMCNPGALRNVPDELWSSAFEVQILKSIKEFEAHKELIQIPAFLDDLTSCLVSFGIRQ